MNSITRIILYKHGVGYFEREAEVEGDASLDLDFKKEEMNDVLKSLAVFDADGGDITSISYDATRPVQEELADIALNLPSENTLSGLLENLKGVRVSLQVGGATHTGEILGIEKSQRQKDMTVIHEKNLVLWSEDQKLINFKLTDVEDLTLLDEKVRRDLDRLMETVIYWKKKDLKKLTIFTRGTGRRKIRMSYMIAAPVWKTSYRILLRDEGLPLLQGWAMVDNTGQEDWEDVKISLVAGLPISFTHDLYTPRNKQRPHIAADTGPAYAAPQVEQGGSLSQEETDALLNMGGDDIGLGALGDSEEFPALMDMDYMASGPSQAESRKVEEADYYVYDIKNPVTVKRGQSALVPILAEECEGKQVALYNERIRKENPLTALLLKNTSGVMLEGGPLTVYTSGEYLGEGMLNGLKENEETLLPFAVELGCRIKAQNTSDEKEIYKIVLDGNDFYTHHQVLRKTTYKIDNSNGSRGFELYLDHPFDYSWKPTENSIPQTETESYYRYKTEIQPGETTDFTVEEQGESSQHFRLASLDDEKIEFYLAGNHMDQKTADRIRELSQLREKLNKLSTDLSDHNNEKQKIFKNQTRLRENLNTLGDAAEDLQLRKRYLEQFNSEEDRLQELEKEIEELETNQKEGKRNRDTKLRDLSYSL